MLKYRSCKLTQKPKQERASNPSGSSRSLIPSLRQSCTRVTVCPVRLRYLAIPTSCCHKKVGGTFDGASQAIANCFFSNSDRLNQARKSSQLIGDSCTIKIPDSAGAVFSSRSILPSIFRSISPELGVVRQSRICGVNGDNSAFPVREVRCDESEIFLTAINLIS